MDDEPEVIRRQMEGTRSSLTDKIERLEQTVTDKVQTTTAAVTGTVQSVKDAVHDTVDTVKCTVNNTVETVKETFDVRRYFAQYPWASFGASVGLGFAGGVLLESGHHARGDRIGELHSRGEVGRASAPSHNGGARKRSPAARMAAPAQAGQRLVGEVASKFGDELGKLKGVALGAVFGLVRDWISRSAPPEVGTKVGEVIDDVTRKLGGEPLRGNLLESFGGLARGKASREKETVSDARGNFRAPSV
jgi:ElaB/YqjD/DUF883 family membrane-anchored ribosome-binding protein